MASFMKSFMSLRRKRKVGRVDSITSDSTLSALSSVLESFDENATPRHEISGTSNSFMMGMPEETPFIPELSSDSKRPKDAAFSFTNSAFSQDSRNSRKASSVRKFKTRLLHALAFSDDKKDNKTKGCHAKKGNDVSSKRTISKEKVAGLMGFNIDYFMASVLQLPHVMELRRDLLRKLTTDKETRKNLFKGKRPSVVAVEIRDDEQRFITKFQDMLLREAWTNAQGHVATLKSEISDLKHQISEVESRARATQTASLREVTALRQQIRKLPEGADEMFFASWTDVSNWADEGTQDLIHAAVTEIFQQVCADSMNGKTSQLHGIVGNVMKDEHAALQARELEVKQEIDAMRARELEVRQQCEQDIQIMKDNCEQDIQAIRDSLMQRIEALTEESASSIKRIMALSEENADLQMAVEAAQVVEASSLKRIVALTEENSDLQMALEVARSAARNVAVCEGSVQASVPETRHCDPSSLHKPPDPLWITEEANIYESSNSDGQDSLRSPSFSVCADATSRRESGIQCDLVSQRYLADSPLLESSSCFDTICDSSLVGSARSSKSVPCSSVAQAQESRPILPSASSAVLLTHSVNLHDRLQSSSDQALDIGGDLLLSLGRLGKQLDDEVLDDVKTLYPAQIEGPLAIATQLMSRRIQGGRVEIEALRNLCIHLIESGRSFPLSRSQMKSANFESFFAGALKGEQLSEVLHAASNAAGHIEDSRAWAQRLHLPLRHETSSPNVVKVLEEAKTACTSAVASRVNSKMNELQVEMPTINASTAPSQKEDTQRGSLPALSQKQRSGTRDFRDFDDDVIPKKMTSPTSPPPLRKAPKKGRSPNGSLQSSDPKTPAMSISGGAMLQKHGKLVVS